MNDVDVLATFIKAMVKYPDSVHIERKVDERGVLLLIKIEKEDMGTVIGKGGKHIHALRLLMAVIGAKNNANVAIMVVEPENSIL